MVDDLASITPQTLQATAAKYLQPDKDWTLAVVPRKPGEAPPVAGK